MHKWQKKYLLGDKIIDQQHQSFFTKINLLETNKNKFSKIDISMMVIFLQDYARFHFKCEEEFMAKNKYPDLEIHAQIHKQFINQVEIFCEKLRFCKTPIAFTKKITSFMQDWLIHHIVKVDMAIMTYLKTGQREDIVDELDRFAN